MATAPVTTKDVVAGGSPIQRFTNSLLWHDGGVTGLISEMHEVTNSPLAHCTVMTALVASTVSELLRKNRSS
jgi:hypothetical protein